MIKNRSPQFDQYYYSLDWHPSDHVSFIDNVHQRRLAPGSKEPCLYGTVTFEGPPKMDQVFHNLSSRLKIYLLIIDVRFFGQDTVFKSLGGQNFINN